MLRLDASQALFLASGMIHRPVALRGRPERLEPYTRQSGQTSRGQITRPLGTRQGYFMSDEFSNRLADLWQQGGRDLAVGFLRRATSVDHTLAEVLAALQFDGVQEHLGSIRLREVFGPASQPKAPRAQADAATRPAPTATKTRRHRRTSEEMQQMRNLLQSALTDEPGSLDTVQLVQMLGDKGHKVDTIIVNTLLKALESEGHIVSLGGKPKGWRTVNTSRAAATPMIIRRAHDQLT